MTKDLSGLSDVHKAMNAMLESSRRDEAFSASLVRPARNPAASAVAQLMEEISSFEETLSPEEEVGGIIIGAPDGTAFHIRKFHHLSMDILVFEGVNGHGKPQRLVQHVSQLSILLTALPKLEEKPIRIGFLSTTET